MIDNYAKAMKLVQKMKAHTPITAHPTKSFIHSMRQNGIKVTSKQILKIEDVLYMGDEGGIGCVILAPGDEKTLTMTSLTHIRIEAKHPLAKEIHAYQTERTQKLAQINKGRKPSSRTIHPRRKKR